MGLKNRVHVQIFGYPTPVVQNGVKRTHLMVKCWQMVGLNMSFLKGSGRALLGTKYTRLDKLRIHAILIFIVRTVPSWKE